MRSTSIFIRPIFAMKERELIRDHSQLISERTFFRGRGGLEICKKQPDISILVAFFVRTFVGGGGRGVKILKIRNVRRTLIVNDPLSTCAIWALLQVDNSQLRLPKYAPSRLSSAAEEGATDPTVLGGIEHGSGHSSSCPSSPCKNRQCLHSSGTL